MLGVGHRWDPWQERPSGLVVPTRIDPDGSAGPTRAQARGPYWRQVAHGWYVPSSVDGTRVEQRILEQGVRVPSSGGVTAWASLRWRGGTFFDGLADGGRTVLPIPLLPGGVGNLGRDPRASVSREQFAPYEREVVAGLGCATVTRAVFDEIRRCGSLRRAVVSIEMAVAAGLTTVEEVSTYVGTRSSWTGVPLARKAAGLAGDHSRSPQETLMKLIWRLDAGFPEPVCNRAIFDLQGNLLGYPDLLDPVAGVVGEYDGEDHRSAARHRADVAREELFRDHGLEYFTVVGDDMAHPGLVVTRMQRARARAKFLPPESRAWTLEPPPWWNRPLHR